jgi:hypothetical protein
VAKSVGTSRSITGRNTLNSWIRTDCTKELGPVLMIGEIFQAIRQKRMRNAGVCVRACACACVALFVSEKSYSCSLFHWHSDNGFLMFQKENYL